MSDLSNSAPIDQDGYSVAEAAEHFGVTPRAVRRYIERGQLAAKRLRTAKGIEWRITSLDLRRPPADSTNHAEDLRDESGDDRGQPQMAEDLPEPAQESASPSPQENAPLLRALEMIAERDRRIAELEEVRFQLAGQIGFYQAQLQAAQEEIKLLGAPRPRRPWWAFWHRSAALST
jgi:hypothetical protein